MSALTAAEDLPCMQVLTTAPASPQVLLQAAQSKGGWARLVRLLLGRDPAYEPASEAGERPMGVEFWAVSGPGRWLQGCMRVRLLWPDINDWSPLVSNGRLFSELAIS